MNLENLTIDIEQHIDVKATASRAFERTIAELTAEMRYPDGRSFNMKLEAFPGGRWYRDLGEDTGHLWGTVQTYKPGALVEITGQMFMSYPVMNHLELKFTEQDGGTRIALRHRALGLIAEEHRQGVRQGWGEMLQAIHKDLGPA